MHIYAWNESDTSQCLSRRAHGRDWRSIAARICSCSLQDSTRRLQPDRVHVCEQASPVLSDLSGSTWCRREKRVQAWPAFAGATPTAVVGAFRSDSMDSSGGVMVMIDDAAAGFAAAQHATAVPPPAQSHVTNFKPQHASVTACCGPACAGGCGASCQAGAWIGGANVPPKHSTLRTAQVCRLHELP